MNQDVAGSIPVSHLIISLAEEKASKMRDWSKIPKQTFLSEHGQIGDCWRCCIAAVIGMDAELVPHFLLMRGGGHNPYCDEDTQEWLNEKGYAFIRVMGKNNIRYDGFYESKIPLPLISAGPTERSKGMGKHHAVVTIDNEVVYDPHPSEAGLTAITEQYLVFKL